MKLNVGFALLLKILMGFVGDWGIVTTTYLP